MGVLTTDHSFTTNESSGTWNVPVSGNYMFYAVGVFSGGCLSLESSPDKGVNWFTVEQLTKAGRLIRYLVNGETIRFTLVDSVTPTITTGIRQ